MGEGNQGFFLMALMSMLSGQLCFLRLGYAYLTRVAPVPREARWEAPHLKPSNPLSAAVAQGRFSPLFCAV